MRWLLIRRIFPVTLCILLVVAFLFLYVTHKDKIDFSTRVKPILNNKCTGCYGRRPGKVGPFGIQATTLNPLNFDQEKLIYESRGRPFGLTDIRGKVISKIIA